MQDKQFKTAVINCRSDKNKTAAHEVYMSSKNMDIIFGTESWINSDILDAEIFPQNFLVFRKDREYKRGGGGVFIL